LVVVLVGLVLAASCRSTPKPAAVPASPPAPSQHASLLIGTAWFAVAASDGTGGTGPPSYVLDLPAQTLVEVSGYGSLTLAQARATGGVPLLASAVSGLLGIILDGSTVVAAPSPRVLYPQAMFEELPVRPAGSDAAGPVVRAAPADLQALVARHLAGSRGTGERLLGRRVEILNGTPSPAAARQAALLLVPHAFLIARQAPAERSDYATTQIVVYSGSAASRQMAGEVRDALGRGAVVVAGQTPRPSSGSVQVVVDATVILGGDFAALVTGGK